MKTSLFLFLLIAFGKVTYSQQIKQSIDYQYFRDDKSYFAFELFKDGSNGMEDQLNINFTSSSTFTKIDKIYIKAGVVELKLKFKIRDEKVKSDNPELKSYPIMFNSKDLDSKQLGCNAQIIFKLDNGALFTLPFTACNIKQFLAKN